MGDVLRPTIAPLLSLLNIMIGISFFNTFISVRITEEGWSTLMIGVLYSSYYGGMMLGALYIEKMLKRSGYIRGFSIFAAMTAASILLQSFTLSPYTWLFYRLLTGLGCAGLFVVIESWLLLLSNSSTRGTVLAVYMVVLYSAQTMGQFVLNIIPVESLTAFSFAAFFCVISLIPVCLMNAAVPSSKESDHISIFYLLKKVPLGFLGNLVSGMILSSFYALGPVFAQGSDFSIWEISLVMASVIFGGMALQWPIGLISDLIERRKVIIITSMILMFTSLILFIFPNMPFYLLLFLLFLYGGFSFTLYPISIAYCCDFFSAAGITSVTCGALIVYGIGCIFGPLLSPLLMEVTSPSGLFLYSAILSFGLALYASFRSHQLSGKMPVKHEPYQPMPGVSQKASELDPRIDK